MANIAIFITSVSVTDTGSGAQDLLFVHGLCQTAGSPASGQGQTEWQVALPFTLSADEINSACIDAAVAASNAHGFEVAAGDVRRLFGGAHPNIS